MALEPRQACPWSSAGIHTGHAAGPLEWRYQHHPIWPLSFHPELLGSYYQSQSTPRLGLLFRQMKKGNMPGTMWTHEMCAPECPSCIFWSTEDRQKCKWKKLKDERAELKMKKQRFKKACVSRLGNRVTVFTEIRRAENETFIT